MKLFTLLLLTSVFASQIASAGAKSPEQYRQEAAAIFITTVETACASAKSLWAKKILKDANIVERICNDNMVTYDQAGRPQLPQASRILRALDDVLVSCEAQINNSRSYAQTLQLNQTVNEFGRYSTSIYDAKYVYSLADIAYLTR